MNIQTDKNENLLSYLKDNIREFNNKNSIYHKESREDNYIKYFNISLENDSRIFGGIYCEIYWNCMCIDKLFVKEENRNEGWGVKLLNKAINYSKKEELSFVYLTTYSFQAREFYEKYGFKIVGELKDYPPGETYYTMRYDIKK
jgi:N-acetylglutamate synthase-like GNAT family acetyltransferase